MRSPIAQYLNEIVSLTIMALMCIALVAGQAGAEPRTAAGKSSSVEAMPAKTRSVAEPSMVINLPKMRVDISFRHTGE